MIIDYLRAKNIYLPAVCGGRGTCGQCKVRVNGRQVLACQTPYTEGMDIEVLSENEFEALDLYVPQRKNICDKGSGFGAAVDIGTTTLAFELIDLATGRRVRAHSAVNRQRGLGADVITRIEAAVNGEAEALRQLITEDLREGIAKVADGVPLAEIAITGNTVMLHLLRGYPCNTLGRYPFAPFSTAMEKFTKNGTNITILPGISAFVGADIAAGVLFCGQQEQVETRPGADRPGESLSGERPFGESPFNLLIDLGTNGEMALFSQEQIIVTSAAAGPAFEAANISCGTGSVPGAVAKLSYLPAAHVYAYETIGNRPPVGICGTGVVDMAAELAAYGIMDETGLLDEAYFESGVEIAPGVVFTQKDVREVQLAKSAVRAGIEILLAEAGICHGDVGRVYIAGGFGHKINIASAAAIGIIPREWVGKVTAVGNSALGGAARVLLNRRAEAEIKAITAKAREISLSAHPLFNGLFMRYMEF